MTDYWTMPARELAQAHVETVARGNADNWRDADGTIIETLAFVEDAILQRVGAPDTADPDTPKYARVIRHFCAEMTR